MKGLAGRDPIHVAREDGWLRLCAPGPGLRDPWDLLVRNDRRPGPARIVLTTSATERGGFVTELVVDLPLEEGHAPRDLLQRARMALRGDNAPETRDSQASEADWSRLIAERGWPLSPRGDGRVAVELDTPGLNAHARLTDTGEGLSLAVEVARPAGASPRAREAMARFALILTGALRMIRAAASGDPAVIRLEVHLAAPPSALDLDLALAALSVGYRLAARELRALADERLAVLYLEHLTTEKTPCDSTKEPACSCSR